MDHKCRKKAFLLAWFLKLSSATQQHTATDINQPVLNFRPVKLYIYICSYRESNLQTTSPVFGFVTMCFQIIQEGFLKSLFKK